ncbi:error-prone DNA polymerase, partial [Rathayibacter sp. AY1E8]|uniref:PHP domain-containing protein n=1 Tax=Rathayibacter sp. AY1E8 TaxID=2080555 RepID=UPI000D43B74B
MGWNNPPIPWSEFERRLSSGKRADGTVVRGDGGDSPAWSHKRPAYVAGDDVRPPAHPVPYAELHAHSHFSFLDGASKPEQLVEEAVRLGIDTLALTDHDGLYGIVRMAEAAQGHAVRTAFGAELSIGLTSPQNGVADPEGTHLLVLARREEGYHRLARAITTAQLAGAEKGKPSYDLEELARAADGHWIVLTGCRKGAVRQALAAAGVAAAEQEVCELVRLFGPANVLVELYDHGDPLASRANDQLAAIAEKLRLRTVATGNVHYARPEERPLQTALAAVRARRSLDEMDGWLPAAGGAHLRSGAEMAERFGRYPGSVENTVRVADEIAFELGRVRPRLPRQEVPEGHTSMSWLRELVREAVPAKYPRADADVLARLEKELAVIEQKDFPGYFLIVHDIVHYAKRNGILCQGRGSAANSAVCYVLGITAVDSIFYDLPFERFLSSIREEEPDIDVDFDSERREEVIQYVYRKYGRL